MFDRITFESAVMGGRACIRGMRITVALVVNLVANGMSTDDIIREYPDLGVEDIRQAPVCVGAGKRRDRIVQDTCRVRFLADMGVSVATVEALRATNHDAVHLRDEGLIRLPDVQIVAKAVRGEQDLSLRSTWTSGIFSSVRARALQASSSSGFAI